MQVKSSSLAAKKRRPRMSPMGTDEREARTGPRPSVPSSLVCTQRRDIVVLAKKRGNLGRMIVGKMISQNLIGV
jgi:hypothetical protein